jgi:hypothetical protein
MVPETGGKVWRYLFPAVLMMGALLVLFAGALGDLRSWPSLQSLVVPVTEKPVDQPPPPKPTPPSSAALPGNLPQPASQAALDDTAPPQNHDTPRQSCNALQVQVDGLQKDVAQQTQELASLRASEERERQTLDALRKQRRDIESTSAQPPTQPQHAGGDTPSGQTLQHEPVHPTRRPVGTTETQSTASPRMQLMNARQALMGGRSEDARRMLALAQTQMVFQPVTPDQPDAAGGNVAATEVGYAIRWLDIGNPTLALQQISVALANVPAVDNLAVNNPAVDNSAVNNNVAAPTAAPATRPSPGYAAPRSSAANAGNTWR